MYIYLISLNKYPVMLKMFKENIYSYVLYILIIQHIPEEININRFNESWLSEDRIINSTNNIS